MWSTKKCKPAQETIVLDNRLSLSFSFDKFGQVLITASNDGHIFVVDPRVTTDFNILGHTGEYYHLN